MMVLVNFKELDQSNNKKYHDRFLCYFSARGAFHHTMVYTKKDIEMVVKFARDRGIRVIPEFDVPGKIKVFFTVLKWLLLTYIVT